MEFFRIHRDIPFMRHALVLNVISFLTFAAADLLPDHRGLHLSIEFTGGTVMEVEYAQAADLAKTRAAVDSLGLGDVQVQNFGTSHDVLIRLPLRGDAKQSELASRVFDALCKAESGSVATKQYTTPRASRSVARRAARPAAASR
jgi:preprotein translocase subunit SecF